VNSSQISETVVSNSDGEQDENCSTSDSDSSHPEWEKQWPTRVHPRGFRLTKQASAPDLDLANTLYNNTAPIRKTSSYPPAGFRSRSMSTSQGPIYEIPFNTQHQQQQPPIPERSLSLSSSLDNGLPSFPSYNTPQSRYSPTQQISKYFNTCSMCVWYVCVRTLLPADCHVM